MGNRKNLPQYATQSPALGLTLVKKDFTEKSLRGRLYDLHSHGVGDVKEVDTSRPRCPETDAGLGHP
jgi:hypothetical protein